jgi:nucleotide-binding universal stress UspA family protein
MEAAEQKTTATLQRVRTSLADSPVTIKVCSATGPVAESIADIADSQQVVLIVMCRHGRSGIGRWAFGSVAEKVLRGTNCVTLVIQGQEVSK